MRLFAYSLVCVFINTAFSQQGPLPGFNYSKFSPGAQLYEKHYYDHFLFPTDQHNRISALVQVVDGAMPFNANLPFNTQAGNIRSVSINHEEFAVLSKDPNVTFIDISWRLNRMRMHNDSTRILSKVNAVQDGLNNGLPKNYKGLGVITGIVDIGFQPDNPTFYNADGSATRIKRWWNQADISGISPAGFGYGSEYSVVQSILAGRDDDGTHGTHVGGIAAGSGFTTPSLNYRGMAPESDLVFVTIKYKNDTLGGSALGDYIVANPTILDGFDYIFKYAQSVSKPAVINLSWGMHTGPHDGTSLFDKALESITGPGKILCGSAGNDGGSEMHVGSTLNNDTLYTFATDESRKNQKNESIYIDAWGSSGKTFGINVSLFDTLGAKLLETPFHYSTSGSTYKKITTNGIDTLWLTVAANPSFVNNGKPEILFMLETNNALKQRVRIGFTGNGQFHAWNSGQVYRWTGGRFSDKEKGNDHAGIYLKGTQSYSIGENGGTGKSMITAGSYVARKEWTDINGTYRSNNWLKIGEISGFSSRGPAVDGRIKPDVVSPGQNIISAVNYRTFSGWMSEISTLKTKFNDTNQFWTMFSGTSMASPHVAGIVALMLQIKPDLNTEMVRSILQSTATRDSFTGADSNVHAGYGKVNALAAVKKLIQLGVNDPNSKIQFQLYPNPVAGNASILFPAFAGKKAVVAAVNLLGQLVFETEIHFDAFGVTDLYVGHLPAGLYFLKIGNANHFASAKFMVRH